MKRSLVATVLLSSASSAVLPASSERQCYSVREEIFANKQSLGYYEAHANVTKKAEAIFVSFSVSMPDSGQVLEGAKLEARNSGPGRYTFRFLDGWDNKGKGSLVVSGQRATLSLEEEHVAEGGSNILRNYGTHDLTQSACR